jgi:hypothetical protein
MSSFLRRYWYLNTSSSVQKSETRMVFRVLSGIIAAFLLLIGLPMAFSGAFTHTSWESWLWAFCSLYAGIGLALGARTGRWHGVRA